MTPCARPEQGSTSIGSLPPAGLQLPLAQVNALMAVLGSPHRHAVAEQLLRLVGAHVPLAQCTIFSFEQPNRPRIVAMGDRSRTSALPRIAQAYVTRFFRLDPALAVVPGVQAVAGLNDRHSVDSPVTLHRQRPQDITHPEYRQVCYELPQVAERLALLARYEGRFWMSVNFYRGVEHGPFDDAGVAIIQALAPTIQHAVRLHHTGHALQQDLSGLMLARAARRNPSLTQRDHDVLASLLKGQPTEAMAESLGLTVSSAQTYVKRLHRKLGLSGQRELLAWLMEPGEGG
jgi:DNA-binding CsgD family transcriptional regulator